jgi:NAD(P) transhydrogenase
LSIGPQTTREKGVFQVDLSDDAVQNMLISYKGEKRFPDQITPYLPPVVETKETEEVVEKSEEDLLVEANIIQQKNFARNAQLASAVATALVLFGITAEDQSSVSLMASFALAGLAGYQVVWGVAPALHSPLMAVTNAISGMTAVGGMLLLAQGGSASLIPDSPTCWMGAIATTLSFINISGGFLVSGKMLDLFKRPNDPKDYFEYYSIPAAIIVGGLWASVSASVGDLSNVSGAVG